MLYQTVRFLLWLAAAAAFAQPQSKVLVATGKEIMVDLLSPGTLACTGGTPTNNPQGPPCSPSTKQILISYRNSVAEYQDVSGSAAALIQGKNNIVAHCNLDGNYYGHCWGHFVMTVPAAGGQWEGTWSGMYDMLTNTVSYTAIGYGSGGKLEGLQMKYEGAYTGPGPGVFIARVSGN